MGEAPPRGCRPRCRNPRGLNLIADEHADLPGVERALAPGHVHADTGVLRANAVLSGSQMNVRDIVTVGARQREVKASLPTDLASLYPAIQKQWDEPDWPWKN